MSRKLLKSHIDKAPPLPDRDQFLWCGETRGFGVRIKPSGSKSFLIQYRTRRGQTRRMVLGSYGALTLDQARILAMTNLLQVAEGKDPSHERAQLRDYLSVGDLCDAYLADVTSGRVLPRGKPKKRSTILNDRSRVERHIKPRIGSRPVVDLTRQDVEGMYVAIATGKTARDEKTGPRGRSIVRGGTGAAVKCVKLLSSIYVYAIKRGLATSNPCLEIDKPADGKRNRFLAPDEYRRLGQAIRECTDLPLTVLQAITLVTLTGCRKTEVLSLRKQDIDESGRCLRLADTKTGPQLRPCGAAAFAHLAQVPRTPDRPWVFPSRRDEGHLTDIDYGLSKLTEKAGLENVTCHTLRHSFATVAHELNYSELTIAGLLGHTAGSVTADYAHHVDHALASAADSVSALIKRRLFPPQNAQSHVVRFRKRRSSSELLSTSKQPRSVLA